MSELKQRILHAVKWSMAGTLGMQVIQFGTSVWMARLLTPELFGLVAMLSIFLAVSVSIIDCGYGSALIQKQNATRRDESTVFYFNLMVALVMYAMLWLAAPLIARFYHEPELIPLARFMGLSLLINSFGLVQTNLLTKRLDFKTQARAMILSILGSGAIGIATAMRGYGVWSLALQAVTANLIRVTLFWQLSPWRPQATFSRASLRDMFPYGSRLLFSGLLNSTVDNLYQVFIGRLYSKTDLGFYSRALSMQRMPVTTINSVLSQIAFPAFSTLQDDTPRLRTAYRKSIGMIGYVSFPLMTGLMITARPVFLVVLGSRWEPSVVYFQWLCLAGMLMPLHVLNLSALMALGRSDLFLRLEVMKKIVLIVALAATCRHGILPMIYGQCIASALCLVLNSWYSGELINYSLRQQLRDLLPSIGLTACMAAAMIFVGHGFAAEPALRIVMQLAAGALTYGLGSIALRLPEFTGLLHCAGLNFGQLKPSAGQANG